MTDNANGAEKVGIRDTGVVTLFAVAVIVAVETVGTFIPVDWAKTALKQVAFGWMLLTWSGYARAQEWNRFLIQTLFWGGLGLILFAIVVHILPRLGFF